MNDNQTLLQAEARKVQSVIYAVAIFLNVGSGVLTGCCTYLYISSQGGNFVKALLLSVMVGAMTIGALVTFTTSAIRILPRLDARYQLIGLAMAAFALVAVLVVSGTSNGTYLAYEEAISIQREELISGAEDAFGSAQNSVRKLEQILPIIGTGKETAKRLKAFEVDAGSTGAGKGPIYQELLVQETRLEGMENSLRDVVETAEHKIRSGRKILASIRETQKDGELPDTEKRRLLENGLSRLGSIVIELRQQMPLSSLDATAEMLRERITLGSYSTDPAIRQDQDDTIARLHKEFEPIGLSLAEATTDLSERLPGEVPTYQHMSPTAIVFSHAGELFWVLAVGYSLDILPYMAIGLTLLAHKQLETHRHERPYEPQRHPRNPTRRNKSMNGRAREAGHANVRGH